MSVLAPKPLTEGIPADDGASPAVPAVPTTVPVAASATVLSAAVPTTAVPAAVSAAVSAAVLSAAVPTTAAPLALVGTDPVPDVPSLKRIPNSSALPSAAASPATSGASTPSYPPAGSRSPIKRYLGYTALSPALASPATSGARSPAYAPSDGTDDLDWAGLRPFPNSPGLSSADGASNTDENGIAPLRRCPRRIPHPLPRRRYSTGDIPEGGPDSDEEEEEEEKEEEGAPLCRFPRLIIAPAPSSGTLSPAFGSAVEEASSVAYTPIPNGSGVSWDSKAPRVASPPPATGSSVVQLMLTLVPESEEVLDTMAEHFLGTAEGIRKEEEGFRDFTMVHRGEELPQELLVMLTFANRAALDNSRPQLRHAVDVALEKGWLTEEPVAEMGKGKGGFLIWEYEL